MFLLLRSLVSSHLFSYLYLEFDLVLLAWTAFEKLFLTKYQLVNKKELFTCFFSLNMFIILNIRSAIWINVND